MVKVKNTYHSQIWTNYISFERAWREESNDIKINWRSQLWAEIQTPENRKTIEGSKLNFGWSFRLLAVPCFGKSVFCLFLVLVWSVFWSFRVLVRPCFVVPCSVCSVFWNSWFCPSPYNLSVFVSPLNPLYLSKTSFIARSTAGLVVNDLSKTHYNS